MDELKTIVMTRKYYIALLDNEPDDKRPANNYISILNVILVPKAVTGWGRRRAEAEADAG